ncbi:MAG: hypothetical protein CMJ64_01010 [Planctomycetaceae bacterium]|nr:hypothetical protein [Planctomycetaceae bacterium]
MSGSVLPICLLLLVQADVPAQPKAPAPNLKAQVRELVQQLDADERAEREQAEKQLVELGSEALGLLPPITPRTPAEVKERLGRVRKTLETANAEAISKPTVITLKGEMSLADALQSFEEQTSNRVSGHERLGGTVDVDFDKVPYWQAFDALLDQAGLDVNAFGARQGALTVQARPDTGLQRSESATYSGVFRIEAQRLEARRDLRNPAVNVLQLTLGIAWEPRVSPIALRQQLTEIEITDDRGETLSITGRQGSRNVPVEFGMSAVDFGLPLALPSREAKKLASVKARFTALVPGSVETFEFSDLVESRDTELERAGVVVTFERLRKNVDLYQLAMRVRFENATNALASHRGWIFRNEAYVLDANGKKLNNIGLEETRRSTNEIGVAYLFDLSDGAEGCKFVYKTPALILQVPVEYELKDIELP